MVASTLMLAGAVANVMLNLYTDQARDVVNSVASIGNALISRPDLLLQILGGVLLLELGAAGEGGGAALDFTVVGAIGGVPLGIVSAGAFVAGGALIATGINGLANEANGSSRVEPWKNEATSGGTAGKRSSSDPLLTNKQQRSAAEDLGMTEVKSALAKGDRLIFKKDGMYYSADTPVWKSGELTTHNGGVWKGAKSPEALNSKTTRAGTYDANLNPIGK